MTVEDIKRKLRAIPGMDILLAQDWARPWMERVGRETVKQAINGELTAIRTSPRSTSGRCALLS